MTEVETAQRHIGSLIRVVDHELNRRGVLMIDRAQQLLSACRRAQIGMGLCERVTPASFFNPKWKQQARALQQAETRLVRIIRCVEVPADDHEASTPARETHR
jgi:hypothetical protein